MARKIFALLLCTTVIWGLTALFSGLLASAESTSGNEKQLADRRLQLFLEKSVMTHIPWQYLAAIDQYERTMLPAKDVQRDDMLSFRFSERVWSGQLNPVEDDRTLTSIAYFDGAGRDGSSDGRAERTNSADALQALCEWILRYGVSDEDVRIAMWDYYQNFRAVERIEQFAAIYAKFGSLQLRGSVFPLPARSHYTYRGTWGAARGWGGRRIHEGTDLFADAGLPVRSTDYGIIETKGWNKFGGWRVGIRDLNNVYHYFAHLAGFQKNIKVGDVVQPGDIIGWVGNSGYGSPGTSGKFPPHLHYGTYRDRGYADWAFDPYPKLRATERADLKKLKPRK